MDSWDFVVALAGNPNTGKSTVFNALTGLRQHTGNWPGKTVTRAEGGFEYGGHALQAGRPARHLLAARRQPGRGGRARLHPLRPAGRHGGRGRRHAPGAQPEPGPAGAGDHRPRRRLPEPDGRGAPPRHRRSTTGSWPATWACPVVPTAARYRRRARPSCCRPSATWPRGRIVCRPRRVQSEPPRARSARSSAAGRADSKRAFPGLAQRRAGWRCACWTATTASSKPSRSGELGELARRRPHRCDTAEREPGGAAR